MRGKASIALGTIVFGAALMIISTFLPLFEPSGYFMRIQENTLIQHGGWVVIVAALAVVGCGYSDARQANEWTLTAAVAGIAAALGLAVVVLYPDFRTLCSVGVLDGQVDESSCRTVPFGVAIYVAFVGVGIAFVGALLLRGAALQPASGTAKCPDCAETIRPDAKVCKHCGYRFADVENAPADAPADATSATEVRLRTSVTCDKCQHQTSVPVGQSDFACSACGTQLKREVGT